MHRFYIPPAYIQGDTLTLPPDTARQAASVLRMRPGECILVFDNQGMEYQVELTTVQTRTGTGMIRKRWQARPGPQAHITLFQSPLKRENFEWVLQKCTEVGVMRFVPTLYARTVVNRQEVSAARGERWQRILVEACEQCHAARLPVLENSLEFKHALRMVQPGEFSLIPWEAEQGLNLGKVLADYHPGSGQPRINLFIGPEGGLAEEEIHAARQAGLTPVTLGRRILRSETAAVVSAALILAHFEEMV